LFLRVTGKGTASWIFRAQSNGKVIQKGIGPLKGRGLADAREVARQMHKAIMAGFDPATVLKPKHDPTALTFKEHAENYIKHLRTARRGGKVRNAKAVEQWPSTLAKWVYPKIGDKRPAEITYGDVRAVLMQTGLASLAETQKRVRQRIKVIFDEAAKEEGEPHRYNPALSFKLEPRAPDSIKHHAAAPYAEVPTIMAALRGKDSTSALLLRFSILTAARSGEARGALWAEIDLAGCGKRLPFSAKG
jgi:integrase